MSSITVLSEREAKLLNFSKSSAVISITSPRRDPPFLYVEPGTPLLRLIFSDAIEETDANGITTPRIRRFARGEPLPRRFRCQIYSYEQARSVAEFVSVVYPSPLYIHCLGGVSRSAGMAQAIGDFLGEGVHYGPVVDQNPLVFERTKSALAALSTSLPGDRRAA